MPDILADAEGVDLDLDEYYRDFERHFWSVPGFWKLERQQHFAEPGNPSWEAFDQGRWKEALRLIDADRKRLKDHHLRLARFGSFARRARVVSLPLTPYLQWELHALMVREQTGGSIRIVDASSIDHLETDSLLPEVYTIGSVVMYRANYDANGVLASATKYTDPNVVIRCRDLIQGLYATGEPLTDFFPREVAPLPAPRPTAPSLDDDYLARHERPRPIKS